MRKVFLLPFTLLLLFCASCGQKSSEETDVRYLAVKLAGDDLWSIVDCQNGEILYKNEFKERPSLISDGYFTVMNSEKKHDFYNVSAVTTPVNSVPYVSITNFNKNSLAFAVKEGATISIIDKTGKEILTLPEDIKTCYADNVNDGLFGFISWEGKYGIADVKGNILIPAIYDSGTAFSKDGYAILGTKKDNGTYTYSIMDKTGKELYSFSSEEYSQHTDVSNGTITVVKEKDVFCIDVNGEKILSVGKEKEYSLYRMTNHNNMIIFSDGVLFGLKDMKGYILIRAKYDELDFAGEYLIAEKNEKTGLISVQDEILIPFDYTGIERLSDDRYLVESDNLSAIVDSHNKDVGTNNFSSYSLFNPFYVSSNYFNALKMAEAMCNNFTTESCCNFTANTQFSDKNEWVEEANKFKYTYEDRKFISSRDLYDFSSPKKTYFFDRYLTHETYEYYLGYRIRDGLAVTKNANLQYIELEEDVTDYPKSAENQFVDAMKIVLPQHGFKDNGNGIFVSESGTAVTAGYDKGKIITTYFFNSGKASQTRRIDRKEED